MTYMNYATSASCSTKDTRNCSTQIISSVLRDEGTITFLELINETNRPYFPCQVFQIGLVCLRIYWLSKVENLTLTTFTARIIN